MSQAPLRALLSDSLRLEAQAIPALLIALIALLTLTACNQTGTEPTPTFDWPTPHATIPATATVDPVAPVQEGPGIREAPLGAQGVNNPTQAGLAAEGQPAQDLPTLTPQPTQAELPVMIPGPDGLVLPGTLYSAPLQPAPGVLLLPMRDRDRSSWETLARRLQAAGYEVLAVDLRGYSAAGGKPDWTLAPQDVRAALARLADLPGVTSGRYAVIGAEIGANLVLNACADDPGCAAAALLSPGLDLRGITTADALARFGVRPVLIVASENDDNNPADSFTLDSLASGDHRLVIYPNAGRGTDMFAAEPGLIDLITEWLIARVTPPGIVSP